MAVLVCDDISKKVKRKDIVKNFSYNFLEKQVYAFIGKNNSGVNELFSLFSKKMQPNEGTLYLDGIPLSDNRIHNQICYIENLNQFLPKDRIIDIFKKMAKIYPNWDTYYANELLEFYDIKLFTTIAKLSESEKAILIGILGLASKAEIIIFNHPFEKVDIKARYDFFHFIYQIQQKFPHTFILATSFIDEINYLVDYTLLIDNGKLVANFTIEELKENFCYLTGKTEVLKSLISGVKVIGVEERGNMLTVCIRQKLKKDEIRKYQKFLIKISEVPIQMIFIYLLNLREIKGIN